MPITASYTTDKTIIQTAPLLFTGIVDADIEANFTLYLLQESEDKFIVYAPTFYNADTLPKDSPSYLDLKHDVARDIKAEFSSLADAQLFFDYIVEHLGNLLDLRELTGGFVLYPFDMDEDIYVESTDVFAKYNKVLVTHGTEQLVLRVQNVKNTVIINKRMLLQYEGQELAFGTYMKIVRFFKDLSQLNLEVTSEFGDVHNVLDVFLAENLPYLRQIETVKDDSNRYMKYAVKAIKGNLHLTINYELVDSLLRGRHLQWSLSLQDVTTKIFYIRENDLDTKREFDELLNRCITQFNAVTVNQ